MELYEFICKLIKIPTVSGFEYMGLEESAKLVNEYCNCFDQTDINPVFGVRFTKKCGKASAPKILFDAHIDTIGFVVSGITDEGYLRVVNCGGSDFRLLPSTMVSVYGDDGIYNGVFISVPPHLKKESDNKPDKKLSMYIDVGMNKKECQSHFSIGNCVSFYIKTEKLLNDRIVSPYLDDKICIAALCEGIKNIKNCNCDIILNLSCGEETSGVGARSVSYIENIHCALVADVEFAKAPEIADKDCVSFDKGPDICCSATVDGNLTDFIYNCAIEENIPVQKIVSAKSTGTNAHEIQCSYLATPCAVMSVPIRNMHTPCEIACINDVINSAKLVHAFAEKAHLYKSLSKTVKKGNNI